MSLKESLRSKMRIDKLAKQIIATMRETPGDRKLNQEATRLLLQMTDYVYSKIRGLHLYVGHTEEGRQEVVVLDNELPIYHTAVADVAMRRAPRWKEMVSIRNIRKVLNDTDILVSRGKASIQRIQARATAQLDLSCTRGELELLVKDATAAIAARSAEQVQEVLQMFFELLSYKMLNMDVVPAHLQTFAMAESRETAAESYENLIWFDPEKPQVKLLKGRFSPRSDLDIARLLHCVAGEKPATLEDAAVFAFLAELAVQNS